MDGKAHPLTPVRADQERTALELRRGGVDYAVIAQKMQLSGPGQAYKIVQRALKRGVQEVAEDVRALELSRLDTMHEGLWPRAQRGDTFSVDRVLKIQERRSQYLGLDKPAKHAMTNRDGTEDATFTIKIERRDDSPGD